MSVSTDRHRRKTVRIPSFALYGDSPQRALPGVHIEDIQSRSRLYRWEIGPHRHHGLCQLLWIRSGRAQVALETLATRTTGASAVLVPPGVVHAFRFAPATVGHVLTFDPLALLAGADPSLATAVRALFAGPAVVDLAADAPAADAIARLIDEIAVESAAPGAPWPVSPALRWLAQAALWRIARLLAPQALADPDAVAQPARAPASQRPALYARFATLLEQHHAEHWTVARYAQRLGLSPARLNRLARAHTGRTALDLVQWRLAHEAVRRLVYTAAPIARIADALGFADPAYFSRFVRRRTGLPPRAHRRGDGQARSSRDALQAPAAAPGGGAPPRSSSASASASSASPSR